MRAITLVVFWIAAGCAHVPRVRSPHDDVVEAVVRVLIKDRTTACLRIDDRPPTSEFLRRFARDRVKFVNDGPSCDYPLFVGAVTFTDANHATAEGGMMFAGGAIYVLVRTPNGWRVTGTRRAWLASAR